MPDFKEFCLQVGWVFASFLPLNLHLILLSPKDGVARIFNIFGLTLIEMCPEKEEGRIRTQVI